MNAYEFYSLLLRRAVNFAKREHAPSTHLLRLLGRSSLSDPELTLQAVEQHTQRQRPISFYAYPQFKGVDERGGVTFRRSAYPAPTAALLESELLWRSASLASTQPLPNCYSYRWPARRAGNHFEYFFEGYEARQRAIWEKLGEGDSYCVLILDLKEFYPSIDRKRMLQVLEQTFSGETRLLAVARGLFDAQCAVVERGIPPGSAFSHFVAGLYLRDLDFACGAKFGANYFRYVDDIAVVIPDDEVSKGDTLKFLSIEFAKIGVTENETKRTVVTAEEWRRGEPFVNRPKTEDLGAVFDRARVLVARDPDAAPLLERALRDVGACLPIDDIRRASQSGRLRGFWRAHRSFGHGRSLWQAVTDTPGELAAEAADSARLYREKAEKLHEARLPSKAMTRRWFVQRWRSVLAGAAYLCDDSTLRDILNLAPDGTTLPEVAHYRTFLTAVMSSNATSLLALPGGPVRQFASVWLARRPRDVLSAGSLPMPESIDENAVEAVATLAASGLIDIPDDWLVRIPSTAHATYLRACSGQRGRPAPFTDLGYLDEAGALSLRNSTRAQLLDEMHLAEDPELLPFLLDGMESP